MPEEQKALKPAKWNKSNIGWIILGVYLLLVVFETGGLNGLYSKKYGILAGTSCVESKWEFYGKDYQDRAEQKRQLCAQLKDEQSAN
jgi:hypothetical protein